MGKIMRLGALGELSNPNFPPAVKADQEWYGTVDMCNVGDAEGEFRYALTGDLEEVVEEVVISPPGCYRPWLGISGVGPKKFTIHLQRFTGWNAIDSHGATMAEGPNPPEERMSEYSIDVAEYSKPTGADIVLTHPSFPSVVGPDESWFGSIHVCNMRPNRQDFRFVWYGDVVGTTAPRWLDPARCTYLNLGYTGPKNFTIYLEEPLFTDDDTLEVEIGELVADDSKRIVITEA